VVQKDGCEKGAHTHVIAQSAGHLRASTMVFRVPFCKRRAARSTRRIRRGYKSTSTLLTSIFSSAMLRIVPTTTEREEECDGKDFKNHVTECQRETHMKQRQVGLG